MPDRSLLVLHRRPPVAHDLLDEADRLLWLDGRVHAPAMVASGRSSEGDESAVVFLDEGAATLGSRSVPVDPERVAIETGRALRAVHDLEADDCPFLLATSDLIAQVEVGVTEGAITPVTEGPYAGRSPEALLAILYELFDGLDDASAVLVHGGISLDRIWFTPDGGVALTGWGRSGLGDAHLDLAAAATSFAAGFGPAVVAPLLDAYGLERVEPLRLDAHQLLVHLLS